jgi:NADH-quinone oxidoreductase subunit E
VRPGDVKDGAKAEGAKAPEAPKWTETATPTKPSKARSTPKASADAEPAAPVSDDSKPVALSEARSGGADDLKRIKGIGPKIEGILNGLGIYHFDQIAAWDQSNKDWVDNHLSFKGRIDREQWIPQADALAKESEG